MRLKEELTKYFQIALNDNSFIGWIAELEGSAIGIGGMVIHKILGNFNFLSGIEGYILNMYTLPTYRGKGICSEILERLINEGKEIGLGKIYLHASNDGINIYRQRGFKVPTMPELEILF